MLPEKFGEFLIEQRKHKARKIGVLTLAAFVLCFGIIKISNNNGGLSNERK